MRQAGGTEWGMSKDSLHVQPSGAKSHVPKARHWAGRDCQPHKHLLNSHCFELVKPMNVTPLNTTDYSAMYFLSVGRVTNQPNTTPCTTSLGNADRRAPTHILTWTQWRGGNLPKATRPIVEALSESANGVARSMLRIPSAHPTFAPKSSLRICVTSCKPENSLSSHAKT